MLSIARRNVKVAKFVNGNMFGFELHKKSDVILCLFSAIVYAKTEAVEGNTVLIFRPLHGWRYVHNSAVDSEVEVEEGAHSNGDI